MKKTSANKYFTKETEDYIVKFNASTDPVERQKIFTEHIYYPFYKLAECIIHTFKFYYTDVDQIEDLKCDIVRILYEEKISKFDPSKGTKAYSYFSTIVKHYLIGYNTKNYKLRKKMVPIEHCFEDQESVEQQGFETGTLLTLSAFMDKWVTETYDNLKNLFPEESDQKIADAILTLFRTRQDLDIFQKKALYIYIKEITGSETVYVTKVITKLKEQFYQKLKNLQDKGVMADL